MSQDYRMSFVKEVESALSRTYDPGEIARISNIVVKALSEYEITARCTDLVPQDDVNERLIKRYRACLTVDGKSAKTIDAYCYELQRLSDALRKPFIEMGTYDVRFYLATAQEHGVSNRTLENKRAYLSAFFQWMADDEIIDKNPVDRIKPIKYHEEVRKAFSSVEVDAMRSACKGVKERAIIEFLLATGVRASELVAMEIKDVNFDDLSVHVVHGKGSKERTTYMTAVAAKYLLTYLHSRTDDREQLFVGQRGLYTRQGILALTYRVGERAGVSDVHPHRFRRTFATDLSKRGMEVQEIQKLLGHSNINTTMVYVATDDSKVQSSYKRFTA